MVIDILRTPPVQKLSEILERRYGKTLEVRFIVDASTGQWDSRQASITGPDLHIPISFQGTFLGMARVPSILDLASDSVSNIIDVVRLILEPLLYQRYIESQSHAIQFRTADLDFIESPVESKEKESATDLLEIPKLIFFHSKSLETLSKMSHILHDLTGRWAFIRYADMDYRFESVTDLLRLGQTTILVEDIAQIEPSQWIILRHFLAESSAKEYPMILLGSHRSWTECLHSGDVDHEILKSTASYSVDLDRWPQGLAPATAAFRALLRPLHFTETDDSMVE